MILLDSRAHVVYGMGQEVLFRKIEGISINYWFLRLYTHNLVKMQKKLQVNSAEKSYNIQKHLIAHAQYILNFLDKMASFRWQGTDS